MSATLPLVDKRQIAREAGLGTGKTVEAVIKTLRQNGALSGGVSARTAATGGRFAGSRQLYCVLNRDAASAYRRKDKQLTARHAEAAERVEALQATHEIVRTVAAEGTDTSPASLVQLLSDEALSTLVRQITDAVAVERSQLPQSEITTLTGTVVKLSEHGGIIELTNGGTRLPVPRSILAREHLDRVDAELVAFWENLQDEGMVMTVEPVITLPAEDSLPPADMYGTPWGQVLTASDAAFAQSLLDRPAHEKQPRRTRVNVPIGE